MSDPQNLFAHSDIHEQDDNQNLTIITIKNCSYFHRGFPASILPCFETKHGRKTSALKINANTIAHAQISGVRGASADT
jgi:hypothetical protein